MTAFEGWIDEVVEGVVWGRFMRDGAEVEFHVPLLCLSDSARVDLAPGRYVTIRNGDLAVNSTIWTTYDMETAEREAKELHDALFLCPQERGGLGHE